MIDVLIRAAPPAVREAGLASLANHLGGKEPPSITGTLPRRLTQAVDLLNELHYQARWEAGIDGARIILGHCPYATIIANFPELCRMDAFLLEQRTGSPVEQLSRLQPSVKGYPFCTFRVS
jgi:predicted ArsR family transcriptional regulator